MFNNTRKIFNYIGNYKLYALITPILITASVATEILLPYFMAKVIDNGVNLGFGSKYVIKLGLLMFLLVIFAFVCELLAAKLASVASSGFEKNLRQNIFNIVENFSQSNIDKYSTSSLITRMTTDIINIKNAFLGLIRGSVRAPIMLFGVLIMSIATERKLSIIFLFAMPALILARYLIIRFARPKFTAMLKCYDELNSDTQEILMNIRTVKSFANEDYENKKFSLNVLRTKDIQISAEKLMMLNMPALQSIMYICTLLILWFGGVMVINGEMTIGKLSSFITYSTQVIGALMMVSIIFMMFLRSRASMDRISEILNEKIDIKNGELDDINFNDGSIEFKDVYFNYKDSNNIIKDVNLKIKAWETIGIIGSTGSGKSTLAKLLVRFYDIDSGQLLIGGNDVKNYMLNVLRKNVNYIPQNSLLFSGTIKSNLMWGNEYATKEDLIEVCKLTEAHDFIMSFPDKYDTSIGQGGVNVSGGQRQRLCLARALLRKPKVLILDDSLSAVDTVTESKIKKSLMENFQNTTKIIITQKISSLSETDRIIVLNDGEINGIGRHEELIKNNNPYRKTYELQANMIG